MLRRQNEAGLTSLNTPSWLRHSANSRAAKIDYMLLGGATMQELINQSGAGSATSVRAHFRHLTTEHGLKIDLNAGIYRFRDEAKGGIPAKASQAQNPLQELIHGHVDFAEGQTGITYDLIFGKRLEGATKMQLADPYIMRNHQFRNLSELLGLVRNKAGSSEVTFKLVTKRDTGNETWQQNSLSEFHQRYADIGIRFDWKFDDRLHDRSMRINTGWRVTLGRGLDIYRFADINGNFNPAVAEQALRSVYQFSITYTQEAWVDTAK